MLATHSAPSVDYPLLTAFRLAALKLHAGRPFTRVTLDGDGEIRIEFMDGAVWGLTFLERVTGGLVSYTLAPEATWRRSMLHDQLSPVLDALHALYVEGVDEIIAVPS